MSSPRDAVRIVVSVAIALFLVLRGAGAWAEARLSETVARVKPAIVAVGTFQKTRSPPFAFRGTGFVVDDGRLIATAAHVVVEVLQAENRETMMVLVQVPGKPEPQAREATTIAIDHGHDIALLRITGEPLPAVTFGDSDVVRDGQSVAFTGFPMGTMLGFHPVTHRGIIASSTPVALPGATAAKLDPRVIQTLKAGPFVLFQLDATAYPGHSGSPLYDEDSGAVIGIVNYGIVKGTKDAAVGQPSGISFAVPIRHLQELLRASR